jgi:hypothetical protein
VYFMYFLRNQLHQKEVRLTNYVSSQLFTLLLCVENVDFKFRNLMDIKFRFIAYGE